MVQKTGFVQEEMITIEEIELPAETGVQVIEAQQERELVQEVVEEDKELEELVKAVEQ